MGIQKDFTGTTINDGDVVVAAAVAALQDRRLVGATGVVINAGCSELIGVQLSERMLSSSSMPEVLYAPPTAWHVLAHAQGIEA